MSKIEDGGPAFPVMWDYAEGETGMSLRAYAAIQLRVPASGIDWLDAMIQQARRDDFAGRALAGMAANDKWLLRIVSPSMSQIDADYAVAQQACRNAYAMVAALKQEPDA